MTTELWLAALTTAALTGTMLLGLRARRNRPQPVRVQARPVNRSIER
jgi:hypothetical protein